MKKRGLVKWLHWVAFGLLLYFWLVEPEVDGQGPARSEMLSTHAGMGMLLTVVTLIWSWIYFRNGPLGRAGPKLPNWGKRVHRVTNTGLYWLVPVTVATGGMAGLASDYPVLGFGFVPLNPTGWGSAGLHELAQEIHEQAFHVTILMIFVHLVFHVWRHVILKDNALRIMVPKILHKYL